MSASRSSGRTTGKAGAKSATGRSGARKAPGGSKRTSGRTSGKASKKTSAKGSSSSGKSASRTSGKTSSRSAAKNGNSSRSGGTSRSGGRTSSGRTSSGRTSSGRTSGRRRERDDAVDDAEDYPTPRAMPRQQPAAPPWLWAVLGIVMVGVIGSFFYFIASKRAPAPVVKDLHQDRLTEVKKLFEDGKNLRRIGMQATDPTTRRSNLREAKTKFQRAGAMFDDLFKGPKYRDANGDLLPEYSGYEQLRADIQKELYNLNRALTIND
jgi:hypothetical protein